MRAHPQPVKEHEMDKAKVIQALNKAIAFEHAATLQYKQHSLLVRGFLRRAYSGFFAEASEESQKHAAKFGRKIVALGGVPTIEVAPVKQAIKLEEMLQQDLDLERQALAAYVEALGLAQDNVALRNMLEDQIEAETSDIEELELILDQVTTAALDEVVTLEKVSAS